MEKLALDTLLKSINEDSSLNSLIQSSPVCHKIFDPDFKLKFMSKSGVDALDIKNIEDFYGNYFPTDDAPQLTRDIFNKTLQRAAQGETNTIEYYFEVKGITIWYRTTISPYSNAEGNLIYIKADSMDITDTKKTEDANTTLLETSNTCLKEICNNDGPGYTLKFMSPAGRRQLGIADVDEIVDGPYPLDNFPDEAKKGLSEALDKVARTGEAAQVECKLYDKEGNALWFLSNFSVQSKNEAGEVVSITGSSQNITELVLSRAAMAQSKEVAERASRAKSEFLSRMSHEFRTPLNAIMGFSQLMSLDPKSLTTEQLENLNSISSSGKHLLHLINDILDLAQVESGKSTVLMGSVPIDEFMDDMISLAKPIAKDNDINLKYTIDNSSDWSVRADKTRLKQVVLNLISNAIKYNNKNGDVEITFEEVAGNRLRISVLDTGPGIPEEKRDGLFEPFNRLGAEFTQIEGSGIGLSITKNLVELMGGTIDFQSTSGKGSKFYIELPLCESQKTLESENLEAKQGSPTKSHDEHFKVLYIEDIPNNIELVRQILLNRKAIDVISAPDARLGLDIANAHQPDLILMDINLPGLDGVEACRMLRNDPRTSSIPVIAISANALDKEINNAMEAGFIDYLTKPLDISHFLKTIDKILRI